MKTTFLILTLSLISSFQIKAQSPSIGSAIMLLIEQPEYAIKNKDYFKAKIIKQNEKFILYKFFIGKSNIYLYCAENKREKNEKFKYYFPVEENNPQYFTNRNKSYKTKHNIEEIITFLTY